MNPVILINPVKIASLKYCALFPGKPRFCYFSSIFCHFLSFSIDKLKILVYTTWGCREIGVCYSTRQVAFFSNGGVYDRLIRLRVTPLLQSYGQRGDITPKLVDTLREKRKESSWVVTLVSLPRQRLSSYIRRKGDLNMIDWRSRSAPETAQVIAGWFLRSESTAKQFVFGEFRWQTWPLVSCLAQLTGPSSNIPLLLGLFYIIESKIK